MTAEPITVEVPRNATPAAVDHPPEPPRRVVFVAGSGRSGTSTLCGTLQQLGLRVPQPEVVPDNTNPKGFGEPQWVVGLHHRLLQQAGVQVSDARPKAWFEAGKLTTRDDVRQRVSTWLTAQLRQGDELVIKDPRLSWFLGLWRVAALRAGAQPCFATMLRPPAEVIGSKYTYYNRYVHHGAAGFADGVTAWINMMLHTERATRDSKRVFIRYHDLLDDWTVPISQAAEQLDLRKVKGATANDIRRVHNFVDPSLRRIQLTWDDVPVPRQLRELASDTWEQLNVLAEPDGDTAKTHAELDLLMAEYTRFYADAEAVANSSIVAAWQSGRNGAKPGHPGPRRKTLSRRLANLIPHGVRARIPTRMRAWAGRLLNLILRGRK